MRDCNGDTVGSRACPARLATETQPCGGFPCARWAKWNTWSPCSQTCGNSEQVRVRTCIFGKIGDDGCAAEDAKEQQACRLADCGKFTSLQTSRETFWSDLVNMPALAHMLTFDK